MANVHPTSPAKASSTAESHFGILLATIKHLEIEKKLKYTAIFSIPSSFCFIFRNISNISRACSSPYPRTPYYAIWEFSGCSTNHPSLLSGRKRRRGARKAPAFFAWWFEHRRFSTTAFKPSFLVCLLIFIKTRNKSQQNDQKEQPHKSHAKKKSPSSPKICAYCATVLVQIPSYDAYSHTSRGFFIHRNEWVFRHVRGQNAERLLPKARSQGCRWHSRTHQQKFSLLYYKKLGLSFPAVLRKQQKHVLSFFFFFFFFFSDK